VGLSDCSQSVPRSERNHPVHAAASPAEPV